MKVFSGAISDYVHRRKFLILIGYGLGALTKPIFPLANSVDAIVAARFIDRVGKGIRGAPRDALLADVTPPSLLNAAYGLRQSLDTVGAFAGPLLAMLMLYYYSHDLRLVMWVAVIPAMLCVGLLIWGLQEPAHLSTAQAKPRLRWSEIQDLSTAYYLLLLATAIITLARMTEALLILRAQANGLSLVWIPMVLVLYSLVYSLSASPIGLLAEHLGQKGLLFLGMLCLATSQACLAYTTDTGYLFWLGISLWGLHMGMTQGLLAARVAQLAPARLRGTSFGLFNLTVGFMQLLAGVGFGWLWLAFSAKLAFGIAMLLSLLSLPFILLAYQRSLPTTS